MGDEVPRAGGAAHPQGAEFPGLRKCPSIQRQVGMALFVLAMGPDKVGVGTKHKLMWPYIDYTDDDVRRAASKLLANVHTVLLEALPPAQIERISKAQDAYLSFAQGDGSLDDSSPFPAGTAPPRV